MLRASDDDLEIIAGDVVAACWPVAGVRASAFDRLGACAAVLDSNGVIVDTNRAWRLFAHLNDGSSVSTGVGVDYLGICDRAASAGVLVSGAVADGLRQILRGERAQFGVEYPCPSPTEDRWFLLEASALPVNDGAGAVVFHVDVTARKQLTDRLEVLADHDPLTGLPNRRAAVRYLGESLDLGRSTSTTVWVLFVDINEFKLVNDTFGHHVGDELLVKVGLRARRALRHDDRLCRFGGDEFVIICPGLDRAQAVSLVDRLRTVMSAPFQVGELEVLGRISVGMAEGEATSTAESMLRAADTAMYADKRRRDVSPITATDLPPPTACRWPVVGSKPEQRAVDVQSDELTRAAAALRNSNDLILFFAADGTIEWASSACMRLLGVRPEDIVGRNGVDLIHPDDQARAVVAFMSIPNAGDQVRADFRVIDRDGRIRWIEEVATNLLDDPNVGSVVGNLRDVTERVEFLERVELDHRRLADAQAAACMGSFEIDLGTGDISRSDELCRILGVPIGSVASWSGLDAVHPDDRQELTDVLEQAVAGRDRGELEYRIVRPSGEVRWVRTQGVRLPGPNANVIAGTMLDITDRRAADQAIAFQATHDWLTGLPNPASLHASLDHMLSVLAQDAQVVVAAIGIDNFRQLNEIRGSLIGDDALRAVAARLSSWIEPGDLVGRIRGDEFMVARTMDVDSTRALDFGHSLQRCLGAAFTVGDDDVALPRLLFSIGITTSTSGDSSASMLADADVAMDDAKRSVGDRVVVFTGDARARANRRRNITAALAHALEKNELRLEYQPVLDLATLRPVGFEALLRWTHPDLGSIPPDEFIPIAESNGLIVPIGTWVVDQALQQLAEWLRDPRVPPELWMAVNVSAQQLSQNGFAQRIAQTIARSGVQARAVHLEITESVLMDRVHHALPTIAELRSLGANITIDDFGTGYSSLSYLSRLPVNTMKIDRSFISDLTVARTGPSIVRAVVTLAASLELEIVAEGVETRQQLEALRTLGCTSGQGFLWSRALPPDQALRWIAVRGRERPADK